MQTVIPVVRGTIDVQVSDFQLKFAEWNQLVKCQKFYDLIDKIEIYKIKLAKVL